MDHCRSRGLGLCVLPKPRHRMDDASNRGNRDCGPGILFMGAGAAAAWTVVCDQRAGKGTRHPRSVFENSKSRLRFWRNVFRRIVLFFGRPELFLIFLIMIPMQVMRIRK